MGHPSPLRPGVERQNATEVQLHCDSTAVQLNPDHGPRKAPRFAGVGAAPFFRFGDEVKSRDVFMQQPQGHAVDGGAAVFSGDRKSELPCIASWSHKRGFLECAADFSTRPQTNVRRFVHGGMSSSLKAAVPAAGTCAGITFSAQASAKVTRTDDFTTSGRSHVGASVMAPAISPAMKEIASQIFQQSLDVDAFIRLQNEKIRSGLEIARTRHTRSLLAAIEQGMLRRLQKMDEEFQSASRRNTELEEKIQQLISENQIWFNMARNNEATVSSLRIILEQVLLQTHATALGGQSLHSEGWGENDNPSSMFAADDERSCCNGGMSAAEGETKPDTAAAAAEETVMGRRLRSRACRVCNQQECTMLMLPCRHLCICSRCEPCLHACPVCNAPKTSSLQVLMC